MSGEQAQGIFRDDVQEDALFANQGFYVMKVIVNPMSQ